MSAHVRACFARAAERPEIWIALRDEADVAAEVALVDAGAPLAGCLLAVKDNIDVAGLPTTAGCPGFAFSPDADAPAVARLRAAGAVVIGKTNLDQFATGLVGTRSPYGAVRDLHRLDHVSGGSSSGSAVAVALGAADLALGTDTAGSGRVPAAFQGIVGVKPTVGAGTTAGVVPACRSFDVVTTMARSVALAVSAAELIADTPTAGPLAAPPAPAVAIPDAAGLGALTTDARAAFAAAVEALVATGATVTEIDIAPLLAAGELLYGGAFVAERHAAVGEAVAAGVDGLDPTVAAIIAAGGEVAASAYVRDRERLDALRAQAEVLLRPFDALLVPTTTRQPTLAEVAAEPVAANARLGVYTTFANLLDLCAVAVPAGKADGGHFGVSVVAAAHADRVAADIAARLAGEAPLPPPSAGAELFVVGAHLSGMPLNHQLVDRGACFVRTAETASVYRLARLATTPPKPGLRRAAEGRAVPGEVWRLPATGLASLLAELPPPMALGPVELDDGWVTGFLCEASALDGAEEIPDGWRAYTARGGSSR